MGFLFIGRTIWVSDTPICRRISMMQNMGNTHHGERDFLSRINYLRHTKPKFHFEISIKCGNWSKEIDGYGLMGPDYSGRLFRWNLWIRETLRRPNRPLIIHRACNQRDELWSDLKRKEKETNQLDNFYFPRQILRPTISFMVYFD